MEGAPDVARYNLRMVVSARDRTATFRAAVAALVAPRGFRALANTKQLKRRAGAGVVEVIAFQASHQNGPTAAVCWVSLAITDKAITALAPGWRCGGPLTSEAFAEAGSWNLVERGEPARMLARVRKRLGFFERMANPAAVLDAVCVGPVAGLLRPDAVAPYLAARLGPAAVARYARALLEGRPELWPGFRCATPFADDGGQLATALRTWGPPGGYAAALAAAPAGVARAVRSGPAHLRAFFGLGLRAWGERALTPRLALLDDEAIQQLSDRQRCAAPNVAAPAHIALLLAALGEPPRPPRRRAPTPRKFQYLALAAPYAPSDAA